MEDLNRAIDGTDMAMSTSSLDHLDPSSWLNNLGAWIYGRFEEKREIGDLNKAIEVAEIAMEGTSTDHQD
jgi:hypothetical protein